MKFVPNVCPKCDAEIFADAAEGLCTACLLETGLGLFREVVDSAQTDEPMRVDVNVPERGTGHQIGPARQSLGDYIAGAKSAAEARAVYRARQKSPHRTVALKVLSTAAGLQNRASSDSDWKRKPRRVWTIRTLFRFTKLASAMGRDISA